MVTVDFRTKKGITEYKQIRKQAPGFVHHPLTEYRGMATFQFNFVAFQSWKVTDVLLTPSNPYSAAPTGRIDIRLTQQPCGGHDERHAGER
jgi:hypothetical protein